MRWWQPHADEVERKAFSAACLCPSASDGEPACHHMSAKLCPTRSGSRSSGSEPAIASASLPGQLALSLSRNPGF